MVDLINNVGRGRNTPATQPVGSIPARAGEPPRRSPETPRRRVYPRAGGGTGLLRCLGHCCSGLSPRGRGNPVRDRGGLRSTGSIPARAGEPALDLLNGNQPRVYPRAGGGTRQGERQMTSMEGLSPRGRGNRARQHARRRGAGSIPARAGEPLGGGGLNVGQGVYPRAGGGTPTCHPRRSSARGLSPRGRGNPRHAAPAARRTRSIPARAGEPTWTRQA